jgi:hypothetical protein
VALQFVYNSKQIYEIRAPTNDEWTEALTNEHVWVSSGSLVLDVNDYQMGNRSVISSAEDATSIWLKVVDFDSVQCAEKTGYNELFIWINWTNSNGASPTSGTIKLFSTSEDSYFENDITSLLGSSGAWKNLTVGVGPSYSWESVNSPDWETITGVELELNWSESADIALNVDGLYFNNFVSPIENVGITDSILYITLSVAFSVGINWVLWAGITLIISNIFGENVGQWNTFFIIIGHAFIVTAVYTLVSALIFTSLPILNLPIDPDLQLIAFGELWLPNTAYLIGTIILWAGEVWVAALSAIVLRLMKDIPWGKAGTIAAIAFGVRFVLRFFFGM